MQLLWWCGCCRSLLCKQPWLRANRTFPFHSGYILTFTHGHELLAMTGGLRIGLSDQEAEEVAGERIYMTHNMFIGHRCSTSISLRTKFLDPTDTNSLWKKINFRPITRTTAGQKIVQSFQRRAPKQQSSTSSNIPPWLSSGIPPPRQWTLHQSLDSPFWMEPKALAGEKRSDSIFSTSGVTLTDTSHFFLSSNPFVCKLGAFKAFKSPARRQRLRHQLCS